MLGVEISAQRKLSTAMNKEIIHTQALIVTDVGHLAPSTLHLLGLICNVVSVWFASKNNYVKE